MLPNAFEFLLKTQVEDGGWGYTLGDRGTVEPTAAVLWALRNIPEASLAVQKAASWIVGFQNADGGWGICAEDAESGWQTAWAVFALNQVNLGNEACRKAEQWLLRSDVMQYTDSELLAAGEKVAQIDFSLRGWPWLPGESSWVEPTALAVLALQGNSSLAGVNERLDEAVRYLRDRRCAGGGWNVGNPAMFEASLPARVTPTSLAILALTKIAPKEILPEDIQTLQTEIMVDRGSQSIAWGLVALHALGEEAAEARSALISSQSLDGSWGENPYLTALACLALEEGE